MANKLGGVTASSLREIAQARLVANPSTEFAELSVEQLLHELRVRQTEREILDQELRDSEAIHRAILDSFTPEIALLDREGVIVTVNQAWRFFALENGLERGIPVQGSNVGDNYFAACQQRISFAADGAVDVRDEIQHVLDGRSPSFTLEYPCHSPQQERWFTLRVTPLGREPGGVTVTHTNITQRKQGEQALLASAAQLRSFVQQAPTAIAMVDRNLIYRAASQRWTRSFGAGHSDIVGLNLNDVLTDMPDRWQEVMGKALAGEAQFCAEDLWLRADGSRVWLRWRVDPRRDAAGNIGGLMFMAEDITQRMQVQEALRVSEERFHGLFEHMHEGCFLVEVINDSKGNPDDFRIVEVNSACEKMIGFKRADVLGRSYRAAFPGREETWHATLMHTALSGEPASFERFSTITGRWYAIRLYSPAPGQCAAIYYEITARKMVEEEVRNNADELIRFNQAAVDRELRMIELKKEVNRLCAQAGLLPRYVVEFDQEET